MSDPEFGQILPACRAEGVVLTGMASETLGQGGDVEERPVEGEEGENGQEVEEFRNHRGLGTARRVEEGGASRPISRPMNSPATPRQQNDAHGEPRRRRSTSAGRRSTDRHPSSATPPAWAAAGAPGRR